MLEFETNIGLEIHAELSTETKAFCSCRVTFGEEPNSSCCPVCMGFPGALPVPNEKMVEYAVKMGIALNCSINKVSKNARKNYFYPDLPKGYQISQGDKPLCENGYLDVDGRRIRIRRIHVEEDAGKLIHTAENTFVDYNRAGVPLIEIVTEPDLKSSLEVKEFLDKIKSILLCLDISKCRMQEGNLRCDVNVSVRQIGQKRYNERCEMKNINSFSAIVRCIEYEQKRQYAILEKGESTKRETRRWDDEAGKSYLLRDKESLADYRYFPEPDIPAISLREEYIANLKSQMPQLPDERVMMYVKNYGLSEEDSKNIVKNNRFTKLFEDAVKLGANPKSVANKILGDISRILNETEKGIPFGGEELAELTKLIDTGVITITNAKRVIEIMFEENKTPLDIVKEHGFTQLDDKKILAECVDTVLKENSVAVSDYIKGKKNALGYLVGRCMKKTQNRANPAVVKEIVTRRLEEFM